MIVTIPSQTIPQGLREFTAVVPSAWKKVDVAIDVSNIVAPTWFTVYCSYDGGVNWQRVMYLDITGPGPDPVAHFSVAFEQSIAALRVKLSIDSPQAWSTPGGTLTVN